MSRDIPNIVVGTALKKRDRLAYKNFVIDVIEDTFIYEASPDRITLDDRLFTLFLEDKRFIVDLLQIDNIKDYIDVYLFGVKQPQDRYEVDVYDDGIVIRFTKDITRLPEKVNQSDFIVKGKIAEIE
jgi:hypothetical protein